MFKLTNQAGNIVTVDTIRAATFLRTIGYTDITVKVKRAPTTEGEWDAYFRR